MEEGLRCLPFGGLRSPEAGPGVLSVYLHAGPLGFGKGRAEGPETSKQAVSRPWEENLEQAGRRGHVSQRLV